MQYKEITKRVERDLKNKNFDEVTERLTKLKSIDVAEVLSPLEPQQLLLVFSLLPKDHAAEVFSYFSSSQKQSIVKGTSPEEIKEILDLLNMDDKVDALEEFPSNIVTQILRNSSSIERSLINKFLAYPEDSAGSLMTIEYVSLLPTMTVADARAHIRNVGLEKETIYTLYVTDESRKLIGILSLRELVTSSDDALVGDLMNTNFIFAHTQDDQEDVAKLFTKYGLLTLPVVDMEQRINGIITVDDIMEVVKQEATEDFQIMAATSPSEEKYLETSVWGHTKKRIIWLLVLMISATFTGRIMGHYSEVLESTIILSVFIPMLMDTGGNSGNQSSTLVIRALAVGDITIKDWFRVFWKELLVATTSGIILAAVNFARIVLFESIDMNIALVVCLTIVVVVILAKTVGGLLPIFAKSVGLDPAVMAGPLITTIVDALALLIYFYLATTMLNVVV